MSHAAMRGGRKPDAARLVGVSKTVGADKVREAYEAGLRVFGESKVQEAKAKTEELADLDIEWHLIGHLQKNKTKAAVQLFEVIHSMDSLELLKAIDRHAGAEGKVQRVFLQVNVSGEESKYGMAESELASVAGEAAGLGNVKVEGLMTIPPFSDDPEAARTYFRRLYELNKTYGYPELSMGMTGDFEVAIEEGATLVRVGTAIFGERDYA
jgi:pyridoxal phosphate enzyme (YggS family)